MIIKFDHISYSCEIEDKYDVIQKFFSQHKIVFDEKNKENIPAKAGLFHEKHKLHDLILLNSERKLPVEITAYSKCYPNATNLEVEDNIITLFTANKRESIAFFERLGFKEENGNLVIFPIMDSRCIKIKLEEQQKKYSNMLDDRGFSSLAFWTNNIEKERNNCALHGYKVTEINELVVNGKRLKIFFVVGNQNEIIEYLSMR